MDKMLVPLATTVGSVVGWALGARVSVFLAVVGSAAGVAAGLWFARRIRQEYF